MTKYELQVQVTITNGLIQFQFLVELTLKKFGTSTEICIKNRFLRAMLCPNDTSSPEYNRKMHLRKRTSVLDGVCFTYEQLLRSVQCTV